MTINDSFTVRDLFLKFPKVSFLAKSNAENVNLKVYRNHLFEVKTAILYLEFYNLNG